MEDLGKLMTESTPVKGTQVEGSETPEGADPFALADPATTPVPAQEEQATLPLQLNPYIRFGERIIVRSGVGGTTFITKPYTMPATKAAKLLELMRALQPFQIRERPKPDATSGELPPLDPGVLEYQSLPNWDEEFYSILIPPTDGKPPEQAKAVILSDVFVVTASYSLLEQFEEFLDLFEIGRAHV